MKQILQLSKLILDLSKQEALALTNPKQHQLKQNLLILDNNIKGLEKRLAYTKRIFQFLFSCKKTDLIKKINSFDWNKTYKASYCIRTLNLSNSKPLYSEKDLASKIWHHLKNPKVNLHKPKTPIYFFILNNEIICGKLLAENNQKFDQRKPHKKPELIPISLNPRLARAMVNLTGATPPNKILDPFCGVGGILVEAALINLKPVGNDISRTLLKKAETNLKFYKSKNHTLTNKDFNDLKGFHKLIVTDLPYGRNTKTPKKGLITLYNSFLKKIKQWHFKRAVIGTPDYINFEKLIKNNKLKTKNSFTIYLHKSLSKRIFVLESTS